MKTLLALERAIRPLAEVEHSKGLDAELRAKVREGLDMLCAAQRFLTAPPEPGPWTYRDGRIYSADGWHLSNVHRRIGDSLRKDAPVVADVPYTLGGESDEADGRLIAAAPALLECLAMIWQRQDKPLTPAQWKKIENTLAPFALWPALASKRNAT